MNIKLTLLFEPITICLAIMLLLLIVPTAAQPEVFVPQNITFAGEKSLLAIFNYKVVIQRTLTIIAENNTNIDNVTIVASPLFSATSSDSISENNIRFSQTGFSLLPGSTKMVTVQVDVSSQRAGIYTGYLFVSYNVTRVAKLEMQLTLKENILIGPITILLVLLIFVGTFCILRYRKLTKIKNFAVSLLLLSLGTYLIFTYSPFDSTVNLGLTTLLITPLIGFLVSLLNNERDFRKKEQDLSFEYRNTMVQEDSQIIRSIIGELTVHYASYNADDWPKPSEISDDGWKKSNKVGIVSDTHASLLARYYRYVPVYNQCVKRIIELNDANSKRINALKGDFVQVRSDLLETETCLYHTLIYDLRLLQQTYLAKEPVTFPIHLCDLLKLRLIEFGIIKRDAEVDEESFSDSNARKFTTKISKLFNDAYARTEIDLDSFSTKLTQIEKSGEIVTW